MKVHSVTYMFCVYEFTEILVDWVHGLIDPAMVCRKRQTKRVGHSDKTF